jgi:hypothetical protein
MISRVKRSMWQNAKSLAGKERCRAARVLRVQFGRGDQERSKRKMKGCQGRDRLDNPFPGA